MLDLVELISAIIDAWDWRRILAIFGAAVFLYFGIPLLLGLPTSSDFIGDLAIGLGCIAIAALFVVGAIRSSKPSD